MNPEHIEQVGDFLAIRWEDGSESIIGLEPLRRSCRCARCAGEPDLMGNLRIGAPPVFGAKSFLLRQWAQVGNYAISLAWGDGHDTGIYTFKYLRELGEAG
jgi:DUF971 family protein